MDETRGMTPEEAAQKQAQAAAAAAAGPPPVQGQPQMAIPLEVQAAINAGHMAPPPGYVMPSLPPVEELERKVEPINFEELEKDPMAAAGPPPTPDFLQAQQGPVPLEPPPGVAAPVVATQAPPAALPVAQPDTASILMAEAALIAMDPQAHADAEALAVLQGTPPKTYSASLIGWSEKCMLATRMSREDNPGSEFTALGNAVHEVLAVLDFKAQVERIESYTEEEALAIADTVLSGVEEAQGPLTREGYFELMEMVATWAATTTFDWSNGTIFEAELPVRTQLGEFILTGRVDKVKIQGTHGEVVDYKSGSFMPSQAEMEKRTQTPIYAWHLQRRFPQVTHWTLIERYTRWGEDRVINLQSWEVELLDTFLATACQRIKQAFINDAEVPTPGSHCAYCPNARKCPLPEDQRLESLDDPEDAAAMAEALVVLDARRGEISKALQAFFDKDDLGHVYVGDYRIGYEQKVKNSFDKKALAKVDPDLVEQYTTRTETVEWGKRKRKAGEGE